MKDSITAEKRSIFSAVLFSYLSLSLSHVFPVLFTFLRFCLHFCAFVYIFVYISVRVCLRSVL
jgi:hypothetical protein